MYEEEIYNKALKEGLNPRRTAKGYSIRCPLHNDAHNSAIVFKDDGWACCFAGCGRWNFLGTRVEKYQDSYDVKREDSDSANGVDYFDYWLSLEPLKEGIKGLPADIFNRLGWRTLPDNNQIQVPGGIFIPAFNKDRSKILFCQVRHKNGDRRFSFPSGVKPRIFGAEALPKSRKYIFFTEGCSDRAILEAIGLPTIAIPSASFGNLLADVGRYANSNNLVLVACSDRDIAGDKLLQSLDGVAPYIDARVSVKECKDYGEVAERYGLEKVKEELAGFLPENHVSEEILETVRSIFNG